MNNDFTKPFRAGFFCALCAYSVCQSSLAATHIREQSHALMLFEIAAGQKVQQWSIGVGLESESPSHGFGGLVYEQQTYKNEMNAHIQTLGLRGLSLLGQDSLERSADLMLGISNTDWGDYHRTGLSIKGQMHFPLLERTSWFLGTDIRPMLLAFEGDGDIATELAFRVGINQKIATNVSVYGQYYQDALYDENWQQENMGQGIALGLNLLW